MLRHPSRHYIYYLFSKRALTAEQIVIRLDEEGLPLPRTTGELIKFGKTLILERQRMMIPPGFDPLASELSPQTRDFLLRWGIYDMWRPERSTRTAVDVLHEAPIRRMIEAMVLGPLSPQAIASRVANRFGLSTDVMGVRTIKTYMHYFWDPSAMSMPEWRMVIGGWLSTSDNRDYLTAISAPRSPAGAALVLAMADRSAESLDTVVQYETCRDLGFQMFMEHALLQGKASLPRTQGAFMAFQLLRMADEEVTKHRGGSADLLEELRKIDTVYDRSRLATVKDLPQLSAPRIIDVMPVSVTTTAPPPNPSDAIEPEIQPEPDEDLA